MKYFPGPDGEHHPSSRNINSDDHVPPSIGHNSELPILCGPLALESDKEHEKMMDTFTFI